MERNVSDVGFLILFAFLWLVVGLIMGAGFCGFFKEILGYEYTEQYGTPQDVQIVADDVYTKYGIVMPSYTSSLDAFYFSICVKEQAVLDPQPTKDEIQLTCQDKVLDVQKTVDSAGRGMDAFKSAFNNLD